jgi:tRNA pseudouridine38-40 synthase
MPYRVKCIVSYDGSRFHGYQRQPNYRSVQQDIEECLKVIHKSPVVIHASGRTDAGVHALGQVFHFDSTLDIQPDNWKRAINSLLPSDIYIKSVEIVDESFHSRFSVKTKEYRYYMSIAEYNPIRSEYVYFHHYPTLDINKIVEAVKLFEGTHDFTSFCYGNEKEDRIRTIYQASLNYDNNELEFIFKGNGFLRYQIRVMVGTLIEIGYGKKSIESLGSIFDAKDRRKAGTTAAPQGLYLYEVTY